MTDSLIPPDRDFVLWAAMFALVAFALWAERTRFGRTVSAVVIALGFSLLLSNTGVLPRSAPAYNLVWGYLVPLAIPLLLLKADLRRIIPETRSMFIAFLLGTLGTVAGTLIGVAVLPLGEDAARLAGIFSATYIGGSMNMAAVAEAVRIDGSLLTTSVAADNVIGTLYLLAIAVMPAIGWLRRWLPSRIIEQSAEGAAAAFSDAGRASTLNLLHIAFALFLALVICSAGTVIAIWLDTENFSILYITAITVVVANLFPASLRRLEGNFETGMLFMYLFFIVVGAGADVGAMIDSALVIVAFAAIIVLTHVFTILLLGRLFRLDLAEILIASSACAAGPAPAAALAAGRQWQGLITPAIMLGVFGYVIANFVGISFWAVLSKGG